MANKYHHVAVLMGGWSAEREVSLNSGAACAGALEQAGYRVTRDRRGPRYRRQALPRFGPMPASTRSTAKAARTAAFRASSKRLQIPYTHSGVLASALAMDKARAKIAFKAAGVPVAEGIVASPAEAARAHLMPPPYVVKPVTEGSSVGVFIVREDHAHPPQELTRPDWTYGDVLVERYIGGRELTCAVLGNRALDIIEILPAEGLGFYDYEAKYAKGGSRHILPAQISPEIYAFIQKLALDAHNALGCRGVSRADFRLDDRAEGTGELVCLEVNTQPGMTATSLVPELAAHAGLAFSELVQWIVEDASCDR